MNNKVLVLNTITMLEQLQHGTLQHELLKNIYDMGVECVEIRREFIKNFEIELPLLKEISESLGMTLFYSVNDEVVKKQQVNKEIKKYIDELKMMGGQSIKLNVGNFINFQGDLKQDLAPLLDNQFRFCVENNQTLTHSTLDNITSFLNYSKEEGLDIKFVFDIANWYWVNENPQKAAKFLNEDVEYIHLKNVEITDDELVTTPLLAGIIDWQEILRELTSASYYGLEFSATKKEIKESLHAVMNTFG